MASDSKETDEGSTARPAAGRDPRARAERHAERAERATSLSRRGNRIAGFVVIVPAFLLFVGAAAWWLAE